MLDFFNRRAKKELESKKNKEMQRQKKYKRVNVVFLNDEYDGVDEFLRSKGMNLTQFVRMKLEEEMVQKNKN